MFGKPCTTQSRDWCSSVDADGYGYFLQKQYLNMGSIRNQGWEFQGTTNIGPLTGRGSYSWTKSRVIGVSPKFLGIAQPINYLQYQKGASFQYLPEHTWALGVTYAHARSTLGLSVSGVGQLRAEQDDFFTKFLNGRIRLIPNKARIRGPANGYLILSGAYATADMSASHKISSRTEAVLHIENLTDRYRNEFSGMASVMGRQTRIGLRMRY
jgi:outer membrane receptor protein involved in Fe transport